MNRRSFLRTSAATSIFAGTANTLSALAADNKYRANIELELHLRSEFLDEYLKAIRTTHRLILERMIVVGQLNPGLLRDHGGLIQIPGNPLIAIEVLAVLAMEVWIRSV